jgi:hypothetical protein
MSPLGDVAFDGCHSREWKKLKRDIENILGSEPN